VYAKRESMTQQDALKNVKVGFRLRELRDKKGIKAGWVAKQIGISPSLISYLETGRRAWPPGLEQRYLKAIGEL
jgi:transcriptional regulator with XRE-family HTH domain